MGKGNIQKPTKTNFKGTNGPMCLIIHTKINAQMKAGSKNYEVEW